AVAGDDRDLQAVQVQLFEGEPADHDDRLGHIALPGVQLVDPVADIGTLERAALHRRDVDLPGEGAVDEDAEAERRAELTLALTGAAPHGEGVAVLDGIGVAGHPLGLPLREPVAVAAPHLAPLLEVAEGERPQQHPLADERAHRPRISRRAANSRVTLRVRAVWPMRPMRHTRPANSPSPPPISMPYSWSRRDRMLASSMPGGRSVGTHTVVSSGSRCPSAANSSRPIASSPRWS